MTREIKFRAWNGQKMHYEGVVLYLGEVWLEKASFESDKILLEKSNSMIPMQYTGLKDKNGKEIYEGDIIKNQEAIRLSKLGMINPTLEKLGIKPPDWLSIIKDIRCLPFYEGQTNAEVEVIGNIYSDPHLLNK